MPRSSGFFPLKDRRELWGKVQSRRYHYQITPDALVRVLMMAFVVRLAGLRDIVQRLGSCLGTHNFSSLCPALSRSCSLRFVQGLVRQLEARHEPAPESLVVLDSMAISLPWTQRHGCARMNKRTAGGGVLWAYTVQAPAGCCPVRVLKVMAGAWNDAAQMDGVELMAHGPVYVMDRGFYCMKRFQSWQDQGVRFIVRARCNAAYMVLKTLSSPRPYGQGRIYLDALVELGSAQGIHCVARLIKAVVGNQYFLLVSTQMHWSAEQVLQAYKKRERVEQFHRFLKDTLGLAHLYSFSQSGIMFLLYTALLLAMLLFFSATDFSGEVITILRKSLKELRTRLGLASTWKRNTVSGTRAKHASKNH